MTTPVRWAVETGLDEAAENRLLASLEALDGVEVQIRKLIPFGQGLNPGSAGSGGDTPTVFHGSLQGAKWVQENTDWWPGAIANNPRLRCSSYYQVFNEYLFNRRHLFLPFGCFEDRKEDLFDWVGEDDCIFVRPDSNDKPFTGQLVKRETWDEDLKLIGFYDEVVTPETMCVVCAPQNVKEEYRFFVRDGDVLTGSLYRKGPYTSEYTEVTEADAPWEMAKRMAITAKNKGYNPDPVWVIDLCKDAQGEFRVLEVGSFSCAGIYACNTDILARVVTEVAREGR